MSGETPATPVLEARGLRKSFGGVRAVDGMSLAVAAGSMTGVIGPNGAGKSTLFDLLAGRTFPDEGQVLFHGHDVTRRPAHRRARLGLGRTFQLARPFLRMSVVENMMVAPLHQLGDRPWAPLLAAPRVAAQERRVRDRALAALERVGLADHADRYAGELSGGQRKLLELARTLMLDPRVVLLDEPFAGVNPTLARSILALLADLRREGITFVLVEHDLETVFAACDPIVVMANGQKLAEGHADEVRSDPQVIEAYLGA